MQEVQNLPDEVEGLSESDAETLKDMFSNLDRSREEGLDSQEVRKLGRAFRSADGVDSGPGQDPSEVAQTLSELADEDVDGIGDSVASISGDERGYKGLAGESSIADSLLRADNDIHSNDIDMSQDEYRGISGAPNTKTEIDVEVEGEITVNGRTFSSPIIESKYYNPEEYSDELMKIEAERLAKKISTQVIMTRNRGEWAEQTEFVVATTDGFLQEIRQGRSDISEDNLADLIRSRVHSQTGTDVKIGFTSYDNLS